MRLTISQRNFGEFLRGRPAERSVPIGHSESGRAGRRVARGLGTRGARGRDVRGRLGQREPRGALRERAERQLLRARADERVRLVLRGLRRPRAAPLPLLRRRRAGADRAAGHGDADGGARLGLPVEGGHFVPSPRPTCLAFVPPSGASRGRGVPRGYSEGPGRPRVAPRIGRGRRRWIDAPPTGRPARLRARRSLDWCWGCGCATKVWKRTTSRARWPTTRRTRATSRPRTSSRSSRLRKAPRRGRPRARSRRAARSAGPSGSRSRSGSGSSARRGKGRRPPRPRAAPKDR